VAITAPIILGWHKGVSYRHNCEQGWLRLFKNIRRTPRRQKHDAIQFGPVNSVYSRQAGSLLAKFRLIPIRQYSTVKLFYNIGAVSRFDCAESISAKLSLRIGLTFHRPAKELSRSSFSHATKESLNSL
jgi:hypothetical protein